MQKKQTTSMEKVFNNTENAFKLKSNSELNRAYFLFKLIGNPVFTKIGTALTKFALNLHLPVEWLIKRTVFDHFCGGINEEDCMKVVEKMSSKGVSSVLDYSVEGKAEESQFELCVQMTLKTINIASKNQAIPFAVFKPTGLGRIELYEKVGKQVTLTTQENEEWFKIISRFEKICQEAYSKKVKLLIDGEESWMQDAADELVEQMMEKFNKEDVLIFNTLQCYRWDRFDYLKKLHERAQNKGFKIGMKLVRGAYMEKEAKYAEANQLKNPICETKLATDENFNNCLIYMVDHVEEMAIFAGTHNEESSYLLMKLMVQNQITKNDKRIWFGQLYGMSDNISFNLAQEGYNVAKYLPFGPVRDVVPYLIRRAQENTSVSGQTGRELQLITNERKRRKIKG